jgi:hypothetical protein
VANLSNAQFEAMWAKSQKEPQTKVVAVKKVDLEVTVNDVLDGIQGVADNALRQNALKKQDHADLVGHLGDLKKVLTKVDPKALLKAATTPKPK